MGAEAELIFELRERAGCFTLNRPEALNALTHDMILELERQLLDWRDDEAVDCVVITGAGERAFCAGGDVQKLYHQGVSGNLDFGRTFWRDEYRLNALLANYPKPTIALMDGITMGGGVGVSAHCSTRIVTERTMLAMPECAIGLVPDVGGSLLLARAPEGVGKFMAATGARLGASDAIFTGFADYFVSIDQLETLISEICTSGSVDCVAKFAREPEPGDIQKSLVDIKRLFDKSTAVDTVIQLKNENGEWVQKQLAKINRGNPLAIACAWRMIDIMPDDAKVETALAGEYRFVWRAQELGDLDEGIRALIIDKDNTPKWQIDSIDGVNDATIDSMLANLGENELML